jgi:hypothetical protein
MMLFLAKKTTRSLLMAPKCNSNEEQELLGSPENGDMKGAR